MLHNKWFRKCLHVMFVEKNVYGYTKYKIINIVNIALTQTYCM